MKKRKYELVREDWGSTPKPVEEEGKKSTQGSSSSREGEGEQNQPTTSQGSKNTAPLGEQDMGGSREGEILRAPSNTTVEEEGGGDIYSPIDTPITGGARVVTQQLITQFVGCKAIEQSEQLMSRAAVSQDNRILEVAVESSPLHTTEIDNTQHVLVQPIEEEHLATMKDGLVDLDNMIKGNRELSSAVGPAPSVEKCSLLEEDIQGGGTNDLVMMSENCNKDEEI